MKSLPCFLLLIGVFFTAYVSAQPELDTSFASGGKTVLSFGTIGATADMLTQPDDKIVLIGACFSINFGSFPFCAVRLNPNGSFDASFNGGTTRSGYVYTPVPGSSGNQAAAKGIALQSDGKIVAVGSGSYSNQLRAVVLRYNADGSVDQTFGANGFIITSLGGGDTQANRVVVSPDGKIVVVGSTSSTAGGQQFVARYLPSGAPDSSFGSGGTAIINASNASTNGISIALQPDGKILTGGATGDASGTPNQTASYLLARLNTNGSLDTSFDGDGLKTVVYGTSVFSDYGLRSLAVQSDGRILALGHGNVLFRFDANGAFDASFDGDGTRQALSASSDSYAVTVTPSGKITVVGHPSIPYNAEMVYRTARYLPNGAPDTNYSDDGYLEINVAPSFNDGGRVAVTDSQGRTVLAGLSGTGRTIVPFENAQFSVARLLATPSRSVAFTGRITYPNGKPIRDATLALKRGTEIVAVGHSNPLGYYRFRNVPSGQTYDLSVRAKNTTFAARTVLVDDEISDFLIIGEKLTQQ